MYMLRWLYSISLDFSLISASPLEPKVTWTKGSVCWDGAQIKSTPMPAVCRAHRCLLKCSDTNLVESIMCWLDTTHAFCWEARLCLRGWMALRARCSIMLNELSGLFFGTRPFSGFTDVLFCSWSAPEIIWAGQIWFYLEKCWFSHRNSLGHITWLSHIGKKKKEEITFHHYLIQSSVDSVISQPSSVWLT